MHHFLPLSLSRGPKRRFYAEASAVNDHWALPQWAELGDPMRLQRLLAESRTAVLEGAAPKGFVMPAERSLLQTYAAKFPHMRCALSLPPPFASPDQYPCACSRSEV